MAHKPAFESGSYVVHADATASFDRPQEVFHESVTMAEADFMQAEAKAKIGRKVRFLPDHHRIAKGATATILDIALFPNHPSVYAFTLKWNESQMIDQTTLTRFVLTREEYERYFEELDTMSHRPSRIRLAIQRLLGHLLRVSRPHPKRSLHEVASILWRSNIFPALAASVDSLRTVYI